MERKLFLSSMPIGIEGLLEQFPPLKDGRNKTIGIIPTVDSSGYFYVPEPGEVEQKHRFLLSKGFEIILIYPSIPEFYTADTFRSEMEGIDGLFIKGGDPWRLLEVSQKLKIGRVLPELFARGGFFMAASSGAMLAGSTLNIAACHPEGSKDHLLLKSHAGLNLIKSTNIWPHYIEEHDDSIKKIPRSLRRQRLIQLYNNQALVAIDDDEPTIIETNNSTPY